MHRKGSHADGPRSDHRSEHDRTVRRRRRGRSGPYRDGSGAGRSAVRSGAATWGAPGPPTAGFLHRGVLAAEQLLPGFRDDLVNVGAVPINTTHLAWLGEQGWADRTSRSFEVLSVSRPLLETTLRRRVVELTGVQVVGGRPVVGLEAVGTRWTVRTADGGDVCADLVIDASGRNSRLATWLGSRLTGAVRTTEIDARVGYATRRYRGDPRIGGIPGVLIASTPTTPTGGWRSPLRAATG